MFDRILNKIKRYFVEYKMQLELRKRIKGIWKNESPIFYLLQTPTHTNIGDHAIAEAEIRFLNNNFNNVVIEVNQELVPYFVKRLKRYVKENDVIFLHGGGNMGDEYIYEENLRRMVVKVFNNKIVCFPQTIFFSNTSEGDFELKKTQDIFKKHPNVLLIAREEVSFNLMSKLFPSNKVILTPDIVLSLDIPHKVKDDYVLSLIRNDNESILSTDDKNVIRECLTSNFEKVIESDMHAVEFNKIFLSNERDKVLDFKFNQINKAKLVVTDRLHGMVFCVLTGTPCIVFSNYNQKVLGTFKWIEYVDHIKFVKNIKEFSDAMNTISLIGEEYSTYKSIQLKEYYLPIIEFINEK
ncbi:polysaccharide pyruvyl transferase family protein [Myroides odoratimimus]|uniref:polysaccharide pyruvyl transferase family protein n=1 Tax=Myroides odoratimimus TaxID=76832 RepID=UPI0025772E05|nr:polysaccharide pyruvyl transferase family protein [Myroides odoratimimus]MDM1521194.1 polysaccharide pyruvyl transferase family protein [Myroides odoratimimus]